MPRHLGREIEKLKKKLLSLSVLVEECLHQAVQSVLERDQVRAQRVIDTDEKIDHEEVDVEEDCLKILALHQPVAIDLRFIVSCLKINNDLERIGDMAGNIASRSIGLANFPPVTPPFDLQGMTDRTKQMLRKSLEALVKLDSRLSREVLLEDEEVDTINRDMYVQVQKQIKRNPEFTEQLILFLSVGRNLERIADLATNIAEDVLYMIEGEIVRHKSRVELQLLT